MCLAHASIGAKLLIPPPPIGLRQLPCRARQRVGVNPPTDPTPITDSRVCNLQTFNR
jgi:hypothetical protein